MGEGLGLMAFSLGFMVQMRAANGWRLFMSLKVGRARPGGPNGSKQQGAYNRRFSGTLRPTEGIKVQILMHASKRMEAGHEPAPSGGPMSLEAPSGEALGCTEFGLGDLAPPSLVHVRIAFQ